MTDTQERIVKGCKFVANLGSQKWESEHTKRALQRLWDLISEELSETPKEPEATPEFMEQLLTQKV